MRENCKNQSIHIDFDTKYFNQKNHSYLIQFSFKLTLETYLRYNNNLNISKNTFSSAFQFPSRFPVENISRSKHQPLYPPLRKMNGSIHDKQKPNRSRNLAFIFLDTKRTGAYRSRLLSRNIEPPRSNALSEKYRIEHLSDEDETKNSGKLLEKTFGGGGGEMGVERE